LDGIRLVRTPRDELGISQGTPTPYGAPNANAHVERFHRSLSEEAPNHFIFLRARHFLQVCHKDVDYYNVARPSQVLHAIPDPYPELMNPQAETGVVVAVPVLGGSSFAPNSAT
jgi:hypothetical protein